MDNGFTREKHPILEVIVAIIGMFAVPGIIYALFSAVMREYSTYSEALISAQAEGFAGIIGIVYALTLVFTDYLKGPGTVVEERWRNFLDFIKCGLWGEGFRGYLHDIKENGITFLAFLILTGFEIFLFVDGLRRFFAIMGW